MRQVLIWLIRLYQRLLSPDHSWLSHRFPYGYCKFYPTCSMYAAESLQQHGIARGLTSTIWRIARCHPFSKGGIDPVK